MKNKITAIILLVVFLLPNRVWAATILTGKEIYHGDELMIRLLHKYFSENQICVFSKLTNKSAISSLNSNEIYFMEDGYRFYDYIENNILKTIEINKDANWNHFVLIGKEYILPGEVFKKELIERYK